MAQYFSEQESMRDLESRVHHADRDLYESFSNKKFEAAFVGRTYIVYKPTGLTKEGRHRPPDILGHLRITDFTCRPDYGSVAILECGDEQMELNHIPHVVFDFDVFMSLPPYQKLRWDAHIEEGRVERSLAFGMMFKTRARADFYSKGATMIETTKHFKTLYPEFNPN